MGFVDPLSGDSITFNSPAQFPMGLPADTQSNEPPAGLQSTVASVSPPPTISTAESFWNTIKQDSQSALSWVEDKTKSVATAVWEGPDALKTSNIKAGLSQVSSTVQGTYLYLLLGVVVIAGAIYFIGKGGAIKANVNI